MGHKSSKKYKCSNPDNPSTVEWYVEAPGESGNYFLGEKENKWVFQASVVEWFSEYKFAPRTVGSKPKGLIVALKQKDKNTSIGEKKKKISVLNFPNNIIKDSVPADVRFFYWRETTSSKPNSFVMESMKAPGYCIAFNPEICDSSVNAILQKKGDAYWENRFLYLYDPNKETATTDAATPDAANTDDTTADAAITNATAADDAITDASTVDASIRDGAIVDASTEDGATTNTAITDSATTGSAFVDAAAMEA